jgi:hypothetical protein
MVGGTRIYLRIDQGALSFPLSFSYVHKMLAELRLRRDLVIFHQVLRTNPVAELWSYEAVCGSGKNFPNRPWD